MNALVSMKDELSKIAKKGGFGRVLKRVGKGLKSPIGKRALIGAGVGSAVGLAGSAIRRHPAYEKRVQTGLAKAKLEATRHPSLSSKEEVTRLETELKNIKAHRQHSTASKVRGGLIGGLVGGAYGAGLGAGRMRRRGRK